MFNISYTKEITVFVVISIITLAGLIISPNTFNSNSNVIGVETSGVIG